MDKALISILKRLALFLGVIILGLVFINAETIYLEEGQCQDVVHEIEVFNNETNETTFENATTTFCADEQDSSSSNYCSFSKTLKPGEIFTQKDVSCDLDFSCEMNSSMYEHEIPISIDADYDWIRVSVGTDTKSYPRGTGSFQYNANRMVQCPATSGPVGEGDPQSLQDCLSILKTSTKLDKDERNEYSLCVAERDNFKVEYEVRGQELENVNQKLGTRSEELSNCEDNGNSSNTANIVLLIFLVLTFVALGIFIALRIKEGKFSASPLGKTS